MCEGILHAPTNESIAVVSVCCELGGRGNSEDGGGSSNPLLGSINCFSSVLSLALLEDPSVYIHAGKKLSVVSKLVCQGYIMSSRRALGIDSEQ